MTTPGPKLMQPSRTIFITGFMGAGKSSVARALSALFDCEMADLDSFIEEREGREPRRIIEEDGEEEFRRIETHSLNQLLKQGAACVVALGGGTWTREENRRIIAEHGGLTIWLDAPAELCWQRIIAESGSVRPLARTRASMLRLFDARRALYAQANLRIEVNENESPHEIALAIIAMLREDEGGSNNRRNTR